MRVCILGDNSSVHIQKWIEAISRKENIELHIISFDKGNKFNNVKYHPLKKYFNNKADYLLNIGRVKKIIRSIQPDVVHSHYATSYGFIGAMLKFENYIITGWGADIIDSPRNPLMKFVLKYSLSKAKMVTVLSEMTLKEIAKLCNKKIHLIPFGVDINKFKKRYGNDTTQITIGTIRTLSEKYGVEYLIKAFASVSKKHNNIKLEIVGDGELRAYLENLTKELGIEKSVNFHGYINQFSEFSRYISILRSLDVFVIPSIMESETFGVAAVEASACGIPVIASNIGGLKEVIQDGITGILVKPKDDKSIEEALEKLITDINLRESLGTKGRERAEKYYNWENNVNSMIKLYEDCVKN